MLSAIQAEFQKIKRTTILKIVFMIPVIASLIAIGFNSLGGAAALIYNRETVINHWALLWLPLQITLLAGMLNAFEQKNTQFKSSHAFYLNLATKEISRMLMLMGLLFISSGVIALILLLSPLLTLEIPILMSFGACLSGLFILLVVNLWQIPLWLWLSRKTNLFLCVIINVGLNLELGSRFSPKSNWLLMPWGWGLKLQAFFNQIYPNGLPIPKEKLPFVTGMDVVLACGGSLLLTLLFGWLAVRSFKKLEVK